MAFVIWQLTRGRRSVFRGPSQITDSGIQPGLKILYSARVVSAVFHIALAHLAGRRRQTFVAILGVTMGVGFFIAMAAMMQGFQSYFVKTVVDVSPHIVIRDEYRAPRLQPLALIADPQNSAFSIEGVKPRREVRGIRNAGRIVQDLEALPGLRVSPMLEGQAILRYGSSDVSASINGIDPMRERQITNLEGDMISGTLDNLLSHANGIVVGAGLARDLGAAHGDTISAVSPAGIVKNMKIVGVFKTGITALDDRSAYALLKQAQILGERPNVVNAIRISIPDHEQAREVAARIEGEHLYKTESWQEANEGFMSVFVVQNVIIYSTTGAILIVACFGIFNIVSTIVNEKNRDIAILKSIGFTESDIQRIFVVQGALMGSVGAIFGWGLGFLLTRSIESVRIDIEAEITTDRLFVIYSLWHYAVGGIFCVLSATFAAWFPARKAAGLRPVEILRGAA